MRPARHLAVLAAGLLVGCSTVAARTELGGESVYAPGADTPIKCPGGSINVSGAATYGRLAPGLPAPSRLDTSGEYRPPRLLTPPVARYPRAELQAGVTGTSVVQVMVAPTGRVERTRVVCSGGPGFDAAAQAAAAALRYEPAQVAGQAIWDTALQPFRFELE